MRLKSWQLENPWFHSIKDQGEQYMGPSLIYDIHFKDKRLPYTEKVTGGVKRSFKGPSYNSIS